MAIDGECWRHEEEDEEDDLADSVWEDFAQRWEEQFRRLNEAEDEQLRRISEKVHHLAFRETAAYDATIGAAVKESDAVARELSRVTAQVVDAERQHAVREVHYDAERARRDLTNQVLQESDDLYDDIMEAAAQRRKEQEARREEEKRRRQEAMEARRRAREKAAAPPPASGDPGGAGGRCGGRDAGQHEPPPRSTRAPGAGAGASSSGPAARSVAGVAPAPAAATTFAAFDAAWAAFEARLAATDGAELSTADVPWPTGLPAVSGVDPADGAKERKRKLRAAVLRWHPDKWCHVLDRVRPEERAEVTKRIQEVTRRILDERRRFAL